MKKTINIILWLSIIVSSISTSFAEEWYIEKLLDLNYWVEEYKLNLSNLDYIHFWEEKYNKIYNKLKNIDSILKNEFIKKYRNLEYEYYQTNWIISNYNDFIYHTNQFFYFLKIKEYNSNYKEVDSAIIRSYTNMRSSYHKVKNILRWY